MYTAQKLTNNQVRREVLDLYNQKPNNSKRQGETPCITGQTQASLNLDSSSGMASGVGNQGGFTAALFITPPKVDQCSNDSETNSNFKNIAHLNTISSIKKIPKELLSVI